jgi:hypothetical protein
MSEDEDRPGDRSVDRYGAAMRIAVHSSALAAARQAGVPTPLLDWLIEALEASRGTGEAVGFGACVSPVLSPLLPLWRLDAAGADHVAIAAEPGAGFAVWLSPRHLHRETEREAEVLASQCQVAAAHLRWCVLKIHVAAHATFH